MVYGMSDILGLHLVEAVRVKAKMCVERGKVEHQKFTLDPQIITFEALQNRLAKIFNTTREFSILCQTGMDAYLHVVSDWDLDFALSEHSIPSLRLKLELRPVEAGLEEWDIISPVDIPLSRGTVKRRHTFTGAISNYVEKTAHIFRRALSLEGSRDDQIGKQLITLSEFRNYLDSDGRMVRPVDFRQCVYRRGLEPKLRKDVWKHLLNVYPEGLTKKEQAAYVRRKASEYHHLRDAWQTVVRDGPVPEELTALINLVRKDVRRTDRAYKFFSGSDDNKNITSLFNILTTYAVNHPSVNYCQGMSDLLSPILVTMRDEAEAYICFCGLMQRVKANFTFNGHSLKTKFRHLRQLLDHYDPEFLNYLKSQDADHFFFCYRWLILEMKREFPYEEALHVLEVMWSSLPSCPPHKELHLFEKKFPSVTIGSLSIESHDVIHEEESQISNSFHLSWREDHFTCSFDSDGSSDEYTRNGVSSSDKRPLCLDAENEQGNEPLIHHRFCNSCQIQNVGYGRSFPLGDFRCYCHNPSVESQKTDLCKSWPHDERWCDKNCSLNLSTDSNTNDILNTLNSWCISTTVERRLASLEARRYKKGQHSERDRPEGRSKGHADDGIDCALENKRHRHGSDDSAVVMTSDDSLSTNSVERILDSECTKRNSRSTSSSRSRSEGYCSMDTPSSRELSSQTGTHQHCDYDDEGLCCGTLDSESGRYFVQPLEGRRQRVSYLPPPHKLGDGNPFLMFICLTMLMQYRNAIMKSRMDCNEMAMHFEKMIRKHRAHSVLHQARSMFDKYLKLGWQELSLESCKIMEA